MHYDQTKIQAKRMEKGWSQKELARKIGVTDACISQVEGGTRQSPKTFKRLAAVLGLTMRELVVPDEPPQKARKTA